MIIIRVQYLWEIHWVSRLKVGTFISGSGEKICKICNWYNKQVNLTHPSVRNNQGNQMHCPHLHLAGSSAPSYYDPCFLIPGIWVLCQNQSLRLDLPFCLWDWCNSTFGHLSSWASRKQKHKPRNYLGTYRIWKVCVGLSESVCKWRRSAGGPVVDLLLTPVQSALVVRVLITPRSCHVPVLRSLIVMTTSWLFRRVFVALIPLPWARIRNPEILLVSFRLTHNRSNNFWFS